MEKYCSNVFLSSSFSIGWSCGGGGGGGGNDESREQDPERNDEGDLSGMEIMSLTIAAEFIVQTFGLAYAPISNKSTQARIFMSGYSSSIVWVCLLSCFHHN